MQTLQFIGRGSSFNPKEGNTSAFYKKNETMLLIDCGSNIFTRIMEKRLLDGIKNLHIILTHLHADHAGSIADLVLYSFWVLGKSPTIYFPAKETLETFLQIQGILLEPSELNGTKNAQCIIIKHRFNLISELDMEFLMEPVFHANPVEDKTFGIHIKLGEARIYYSGDTNQIDCLSLFLCGTYDEVYHEVTTWEESPVHVPYGRLLEKIPIPLRKKMYLMHLDGNFDYQKAEADAFNVVQTI
jgi:ribonuclease BN (tRNA processing enzyme)